MNTDLHNSDARPEFILLKRWRTNCLRSQVANYDAASSYLQKNYLLGIPAVFLSAVVGTSVFASLGSDVDQRLQIAVGAISVLASVLAALQTFLRWGELAAKCRSVAAEYGAVKREIDQILSSIAAGGQVSTDTITRIREQMNTLSRDAPELPEKIWQIAREKIPLATKEPKDLMAADFSTAMDATHQSQPKV